MPRSGAFTVPFNPDEATPLPRPFILEGEGKGVKPVSLKPHAPPKLPPDPRDTIPITPNDLYSIKWLKQFGSIEAKGRIGFGTTYLTKLSKGLAQSLLGKSATGGHYLRIQTSWKYNVLSGKMDIPVYEYHRVSKNFLDVMENGNPQWARDPKSALKFAAQLYRYGLTSAYRDLKKYLIQTAKRIRDDQKYQYYIWRAKAIQDYDNWKRDNWKPIY